MRSHVEVVWSGHLSVPLLRLLLFHSQVVPVGDNVRRHSPRSAPGNSINHTTSYFVGNHTKRVFCESVDIVSGIGWDKIDPENPAYRFANIYRVVTNLGVFDFNGPEMRAVSLHPGVTADEVADNTSFEVHGLEEAETTRLATEEELKLLREVIDPKSLRDKEVKV